MKRAATRGMTVLGFLFLPLTIWAAHFLAAYVVAAVYCAKSSDIDAAIVTIRWIVAAVTLLALGAIAACVWSGRRIARKTDPCKARFDAGADNRPAGARPTGDPQRGPDRGSASAPASREQARFMWTVLLLMSGLSALAVIYVGSVVFFFGDCR